MTKILPADNPLLKSLGNKPRRGTVKDCFVCKKEFYLNPSRQKGKYCSVACKNLGLYKSVPKVCSTCGETYRTPVSQERHRGESKFCSKKCKGISMSNQQRGENNPGWKGGISKETRRIRRSKAFKDWREAVFTKDDFTCQGCGVRGGYLEPHHIKPFAYYPELRLEVNNGSTLCLPCHKKTDTWGQKARNKHELAHH